MSNVDELSGMLEPKNLGNDKYCPECRGMGKETRYYCEIHNYGYETWIKGWNEAQRKKKLLGY